MQVRALRAVVFSRRRRGCIFRNVAVVFLLLFIITIINIVTNRVRTSFSCGAVDVYYNTLLSLKWRGSDGGVCPQCVYNIIDRTRAPSHYI